MDETLLHIELLPFPSAKRNCNIKLKGDPVIVTKMIATAMDARTDIAAAMIAAVMLWADQNSIPHDKLGEMVKSYR